VVHFAYVTGALNYPSVAFPFPTDTHKLPGKQEYKEGDIIMRMVVSWIIGIGAVMALSLCLGTLADMADMPVFIDFGDNVTVSHGGGRYMYETEETGASTAVGISINAISAILAIWLGRAVYTGNFKRNTKSQDRIFIEATLIFLVIYGVGGGFLLKVFADERGFIALIGNLMNWALLIAAFVVARKFYTRYQHGFTYNNGSL
jgi:hypothetical protein